MPWCPCFPGRAPHADGASTQAKTSQRASGADKRGADKRGSDDHRLSIGSRGSGPTDSAIHSPPSSPPKTSLDLGHHPHGARNGVVSIDTVRSSALFETSHAAVSTTGSVASMGRRHSGRRTSRSSGGPPATVAKQDATLWTLPQGPQQRLNVVDGAIVSPDYIASLSEGVEVDGDLLEKKDRLFRQRHGVKLSLCMVTVHTGQVRHHLRGGDLQCHHHEIWKMLLIRAPHNEGSWLWPIGREPDFEDLSTLDLGMIRCTVFKEGIAWLDLSNTQLTAFPKELAAMASLHRLELFGNRIKVVPDEITALVNLDYLSLNSNQISYVTPKIAEMTKLRWLSLNANELTEVPPMPLCMERLSLHMNRIRCLEGPSTAKPPKPDPPKPTSNDFSSGAGLMTQPEEEEVDVGAIELRPEEADGGPLARLDKLRVLSLFTNRFTYVPPACFAAWTAIDRLSLQRNQLTEVPEEIGLMVNLEHLWLFGNQLTRLPEALGSLPKLSKLWAGYNLLTELPASLGRCSLLTDLYVADNRLRSFPVEHVMAGCRQLVRLQIKNNPDLDTSTWPDELKDVIVT
ncbi:hypothetical protein HYH03_009922 [Edaphochlamys debaryana]|uniref:Uncharacterized protein n=1 Tax=Edaphochlamys debaryana TaxID=47281 RepID=A0A835XX11_9CHLO|nr:hypothetical protein HYH03_009922 [Edaphochlamys debaryana]|eukprot:KAG2491761.1 hypothetical protein HYH03_009922 [Edaphochlamys debaryana]